MKNRLNNAILQSNIKKTHIVNLNQITITVKANQHGKLFGSIKTKDIINYLKDKNIMIKKKELLTNLVQFKKLGQYNLLFKFYYNIFTNIKLNIIRN